MAATERDTRADLASIDRIMATRPTDTVRGIVQRYVNARGAINSAGDSLYAGTIDPLATQQGRTGDCWFVAALAGLGGRADGIVRSAIRATGNEYVVTFPGRSSPIKMAAPTDAFIAMFGKTQGNGLWLTVLELALGLTFDASDPVGGLDSVWENVVKGGLGDGVHLLTGHDTDVDMLVLPTTMDETRGKLETAFAHGKCVTAGIRGSFAIWNDQSEQNGWPMAHAYTVLDYSRKLDRITVRNPWGHERNGKTIAFADFWSTWSRVAYEQ